MTAVTKSGAMSPGNDVESVYSAIPVQVAFSSFQDDGDEDEISVDLLSLENKYPSRQDNQNGFIFGLRMGFASQLLTGLLVLFEYHDELSMATDSTAGILVVTATLAMLSAVVSLLSHKVHAWLKQSPRQEHYQTMDQDYHLFCGNLAGMYLAWILCDLAAESGWVLLAIQSAVALMGSVHLRCSKGSLRQKRRAVNDDLLRSLDLA